MYKLLFKQFAIVAFIILAILSIVFGSVLPWMKARLYIDALVDAQTGKIRTPDDFKEKFNRSLDFYSLIGDEEIVKFLGSDVINSTIAQNQQNPQIKQLVELLADYIAPHLLLNDTRHILIGARLYTILWQISGDESSFGKAEFYYKKAYEIGPKLPPVLYGMFDFYKLKGDKENMKKIGEEILKYWPDDKNVAGVLNGFSR